MTKKVKQIRHKVNLLLSDYRQIKKQVTKERDDLKQTKVKLKSLHEAQEIVQLVTQNTQQYVHIKISEIVTQCLGLVFDNCYEFKINFERKRGKTEANFVFIKDGNELEAESSIGGGVIDVASFALRLACLILARPPRRRLMILDEPFRWVSTGHRHKIRTMIEILSNELDVQFILVTHSEELVTGNAPA